MLGRAPRRLVRDAGKSLKLPRRLVRANMLEMHLRVLLALRDSFADISSVTPTPMHCCDIRHGDAHSTHAHWRAPNVKCSAFWRSRIRRGRNHCASNRLRPMVSCQICSFYPNPFSSNTVSASKSSRVERGRPLYKFLSIEIIDASRSKLQPTHVLDTSIWRDAPPGTWPRRAVSRLGVSSGNFLFSAALTDLVIYFLAAARILLSTV